MPFQTQVQTYMPAYVPGEYANNAPFNTLPYILNTPNNGINLFGLAYTFVAGTNGTVQLGNPNSNGVFAGVMIGPKEHTNYGTVGNLFASNFSVPNGSSAAFCSVGVVALYLDAAAQIGNKIYFDDVTGQFGSYQPGTPLPNNKTQVYGAQVEQYDVNAVQVNGVNVFLSVVRFNTAPAQADK